MSANKGGTGGRSSGVRVFLGPGSDDAALDDDAEVGGLGLENGAMLFCRSKAASQARAAAAAEAFGTRSSRESG